MTKTDIITEIQQKPRELFAILCDNDFEKARVLWGQEVVLFSVLDFGDEYWNKVKQDFRIWMPVWQYHLQKLLFTREKIEYLKKFI